MRPPFSHHIRLFISPFARRLALLLSFPPSPLFPLVSRTPPAAALALALVVADNAARPATATPNVVRSHDAAAQAILVRKLPPSQPLCACSRHPGPADQDARPPRPLKASPDSPPPEPADGEALDAPPAQGEASATAKSTSAGADAGARNQQHRQCQQQARQRQPRERAGGKVSLIRLGVRVIGLYVQSWMFILFYFIFLLRSTETLPNPVLDMVDVHAKRPPPPFRFLSRHRMTTQQHQSLRLQLFPRSAPPLHL